MTINFKGLTVGCKERHQSTRLPLSSRTWGNFVNNCGLRRILSYISIEKSEERSKAFAFPSQSTPTINAFTDAVSQSNKLNFIIMPKSQGRACPTYLAAAYSIEEVSIPYHKGTTTLHIPYSESIDTLSLGYMEVPEGGLGGKAGGIGLFRFFLKKVA